MGVDTLNIIVYIYDMNYHPSAQNVTMTFGKYKGYTLAHIAEHHRQYLEWMAGAEGIPEKWRTLCAKVLLGENILDTAQSSTPSSISASTTNTILTVTTLSDTKLAVEFPYDDTIIRKLKFEIDGAKWSKTHKRWEIPTVAIAKLVTVFGKKHIRPDVKARQAYIDEVERRTHLDTIRVKDDSDIKIPTLVDLYPFQKVGVEFVDRAEGRALIADSMGLGKTLQGIGFAVYRKHKTLVICPKSVKINWQREIKRGAGKDACMWESDGKKGRINAQFHVINFDIVDRYADELRAAKFDLLIVDEATYLKNRNTKRAKAVFGSPSEKKVYPGIKTPYVLFLTGTPVLNRPIEAFTLLNFLDPKRFNNFYNFIAKYGGFRGEEARNLDDLHDRTKDLVIRRLKSEVLTELPPKQRNDLVVEMSAADMKEYDKMLKQLFTKWKSIGRPGVAQMPAIQNFLIQKKLPRLYEVIDELLEADRSVLVFSCFIDPLRQIEEHYGEKVAMINGSMTGTQRQKSIDALTKGTAKIGAFGIHSGGMGIDGLQHTVDTVIFLDQDWVPANHEQAEDRAHRIGQLNPVQIFYMICEGTIDEYMREILTEKQKVIDSVVDGKLINTARTKSVFKEFVRRLSAAYTTVKFGNIDTIDDTEGIHD